MSRQGKWKKLRREQREKERRYERDWYDWHWSRPPWWRLWKLFQWKLCEPRRKDYI